MTQSKDSSSFIHQSNNLVLEPENSEFENFWHHEEFDFTVTKQTQIISFAYQIPNVDVLACLQKFSRSNTLHFYWENRSKQEAVAGWGVTRKNYTPAENRFVAAQDFIKECFQQIAREGENVAIGKPNVFCSFTFFKDPKESEPFQSGTLFLPRFQIVKKNKSCCFIVNYPLRKGESASKFVKHTQQKLNNINWEDLEQLDTVSEEGSLTAERDRIQDPGYFKSVVTSALNSIAIDEFSKIVIAHTTDIQSSVPFEIIKSLGNLRKLHPDCYIFSTSNGKGQNFIGASPERLISVQNRQLVTDALAGSAPRGTNNSEDLHLANLLLKNRKEKREHKAVSDYTIERLRSMGLKPQQLPLQLLKLSNIQHLWTPIYAHLPPDIEPLEIVSLLHPTPAVAGVSTEIACDKIRLYEKFDRSLYAAPLGWVDYEGNCEFIVGIRSALIDGDRARLYAGAGIVSGSNPDKEFEEVQLKLQSLLKALV